MENLPRDVLSNIFIRLLAKQVAQMRCVCKSWNALLSDSSFVKSHLHRSIHNNDEILLFFDWEFSFDHSPFKACPSRSPNLELTNVVKLPVNCHPKNSHGNVIGSVNGLICFSYESYHDYVIGIWNSSLSAELTLPPSSLPSQNLRKKYLRFGYDPKTDDYKVVKLACIFGPSILVSVCEVYSMKRGSWELISQTFQSYITLIQDQLEVCVDGHDGHLHWLCATDLEWKPETIVAFDLGSEKFSEIPLPDSILHQPCFNVLGVLGGKLCVMQSRVRDDECEVWVMDEYGVPESWVKHHAFSQFGGYINPYGFTLQNKFLFRVGGYFGLYDPIAAKTKIFKILRRQFGITKVVNYVDSLVRVAPARV